MITKIIKNKTSTIKTWCGQTVAPSGMYEIQPEEELRWSRDDTLIYDLSAGNAVLCDGITEYNYFQEAMKILKATGGVIEELVITFNKDSKSDYVMADEPTYSVVGNFCFKGTHQFEPTTLMIISSKSESSSGDVCCRIYDIDNDNVIAEISWDEHEKDIHTTNALQNLPETIAKMEIHLKTHDCAIEARLHTLHLY